MKEAIVQALSRWHSVLEADVKTAVAAGELPDVDPGQVAFEFNAIAQGVNQALQLSGDEQAVPRGRRAMRRALHLD